MGNGGGECEGIPLIMCTFAPAKWVLRWLKANNTLEKSYLTFKREEVSALFLSVLVSLSLGRRLKRKKTIIHYYLNF